MVFGVSLYSVFGFMVFGMIGSRQNSYRGLCETPTPYLCKMITAINSSQQAHRCLLGEIWLIFCLFADEIASATT